jgi:hypothetical protein
MERRKMAFWITTALFCVALGGSALGHLMRNATIVESMGQLGYPVYVMTILGVAKLSGVIALLLPGRPLLKEWAYAGFAFNLIGATASHAFSGDPMSHTIRPFLVLLIGVASYLLRPVDRRLLVSPVWGGASSAATPAAVKAR